MNKDTYSINEHGVATKPLTETIYEDKHWLCAISYAEYEGKWDYGYDCQKKGSSVGCGGSSCLPSFSSPSHKRQYFPNQKAARKAAIELLIKTVKQWRHHPSGKSNQCVLEALKGALCPQLTLF